MSRDYKAHVLEFPVNNLRVLDHAPNAEFCGTCRRTLNPFEAGIDVFERPKGGPRLSVSQDGFVLESSRLIHKFGLWNCWSDSSRSQWLAVDYHLISPTRIVRTRQTDQAKVDGNLCAECGAVAFDTRPEAITLHFGEAPVGPQEVVKTDFTVGRHAEVWIVGGAIAECFEREPQGKVRLAERITHEEWPSEPNSNEPIQAEITQFPKPFKERPQKGTIRNPLLPPDLQ